MKNTWFPNHPNIQQLVLFNLSPHAFPLGFAGAFHLRQLRDGRLGGRWLVGRELLGENMGDETGWNYGEWKVMRCLNKNEVNHTILGKPNSIKKTFAADFPIEALR